MQNSEHLLWRSERDTARWATRLAQQPALRKAFITLRGDLGVGKTTVVRHLLHALGVQGHVRSPTYTVVEPYETPDGLSIWHFDFYRFRDPQELEDAGLGELLSARGLKLAEWPEHAEPLLPAPDLAVLLEITGDTERKVTVSAGTDIGSAILCGLEP